MDSVSDALRSSALESACPERDAAMGLLMGLAAGDRNGGPQRLAMRVAEAMLLQPTPPSSTTRPSQLHVAAIVRRYASWMVPGTHHGGAAIPTNRESGLYSWPPEPEKAYDTGAVFARVFSALLRRSDLTLALAAATTAPMHGDDDEVDLDADPDSVVDATFAIAEADCKRFQSAGVGACHRNAVVAASRRLFASNTDAAEAARRESRITHSHPEAVETAAAVAVICRSLIESASKGTGAPSICRSRILGAVAAAAVVCDFDAAPALKGALAKYLARSPPPPPASSDSPCDDDATATPVDPREPAHRDGFSPLVLEVALYFLWYGASFSDALAASIAYAGPANFCPVLVGSMGGALWGHGGPRGVQPDDLRHPHYTRSAVHAPRYEAAAAALAAEWQREPPMP